MADGDGQVLEDDKDGIRNDLRWTVHNSFSTTASISAQPRWLY